MTRAGFDAARRLIERARERVRHRLSADGGFILLESVIAITLITVIMGAVGAEYVSGLASTNHQRAETTAVQLADSSMEDIRALDPSDLLLGRNQSDVTSERNALAAISAVSPWISTSAGNLAYDATAAVGSATAKVSPAAQTQKPGGIAYKVYEYLDCYLTSSDGSCQTSSSSTVNFVRATVAVTWLQHGCQAGMCGYVTSSLINADADPEFDDNQTLPPAPQAQTPPDQSVEVGDSVSLQLTVRNNTGVGPFFWSATTGSLPTGLTINPAGLITGTVGGSSGTVTTTVTVTDGFGSRSDSTTFNWTVYNQLKFNTVAAQNNLTTDSVNVSVGATGGKSPYTFSDPGGTLPAGLTISSGGTITGTPAAGVYNVTLTVTDSLTNHAATSNRFVWTVSYPPVSARNPGAQTSTVNRAATSLAMSATGGSGTGFTWTATGLPTGVTLSGSTISGTPTATGTYNVTITARDSVGNTNSQNFTWRVVAAPTISSPGAQSDTLGGGASVALTYSCPNTPCTYVLNNGPTGLSASTGTILGTVGGTAKTYTGVTVTITDAAGAAATSSSFNWVVYAAPTITSPGAQSDTLGGSVSVGYTVTCPNTPCTYTLNNGPSGLTAGNGTITGTVTGTAKTYSNASLTVTDNDGISRTTGSFSWTINPAPTITAPSALLTTYKRSTSVSLDMSTAVSNGTGPYTFSATNLPSWLSISSAGLITGTSPNGNSKTTGIKVTVRDSNGVTATTASFTWHVSNLNLSIGDYSFAQGASVSINLANFVSGGSSPYTYTASNLPAGLTLSSGTISGTVNTTGTRTVTVTATDSTGAVVSDTTTITVS